MGLKLIPAGQGFDALTEAVTTEFGALIDLVRQAVREKVRLTPAWCDHYVDVQGMYSDRAVVRLNGRLWAYPYTVAADNTIAVGEPSEVVLTFALVREAVKAASAAGLDVCMREAADGSIEVTLIRAGLSLNGNFYPDAALQAAVPLFEGVRVFVKSDEVHTKGGGKDVRSLLGGVYGVRFVAGAGSDGGALVGTFKPIDPADAVVVKMTEAVKRGLQGLMGLSIDATATTKREARGGKQVRVAQRFAKVNSVDLIVEPGAGGGLDRLAEAAADPTVSTDLTPDTGELMFKKTLLLAAVAALSATSAVVLTEASPGAQVFTALQEGCKAAGVELSQVVAVIEGAADEAAVTVGVARLVEAVRVTEARRASAAGGGDAPVTQADLAMFRTRSTAALKVAGCGLPQAARERVQQQLDARERFTEADVDTVIAAERAYLARFTESGAVRMGGLGSIEVQDRSVAVGEMLDAFFDPAHKDHRKVHSFKECYIEITGDKYVTGRLQDCDMPRLRESLGAAIDFREAISSSTFANVLGDSITRRMLAVYGQQTDLQTWRRVASVTSVGDFRSNERTTMGGYGNLPAVAQGADYAALTSPSDLKATYAVTKRGGLETLTLESIKNDDVGMVRRIPIEMALAAANTLYEFVFDFFRTNPTIYDAAALYTVGKGNLFTTAFSAAQFQVHRLAMQKQVRLSSAKRRGTTPKFLLLPVDLQEAGFDAFQRDQNNDPKFVSTVQPEIIVPDYWTDANDWCTVADPMKLPVLEIGFLDGREEPEVFLQDMPNVGSLFAADKITYKIRHIYSGAVLPEGEK
ncbi:MAG: hypothetical protein Q8R98_17955, partial [Rubrivivax sp.]|nr:hypothetical protein [Rubrivivax sp.]